MLVVWKSRIWVCFTDVRFGACMLDWNDVVAAHASFQEAKFFWSHKDLGVGIISETWSKYPQGTHETVCEGQYQTCDQDTNVNLWSKAFLLAKLEPLDPIKFWTPGHLKLATPSLARCSSCSTSILSHVCGTSNNSTESVTWSHHMWRYKELMDTTQICHFGSQEFYFTYNLYTTHARLGPYMPAFQNSTTMLAIQNISLEIL